jgi:uncharacterized membrane protein
MVLGAVMTALVIMLQLIGTYTAFFGPFTTAPALVPIVIGAALCGVQVGAWLGLVFGTVVLLTGGAALFFAFDIPGTLITVLVKGAACGAVSALVYRLVAKWNEIVATVVAAIACPVVNTAVFLLGCAVFFVDSAADIGAAIGMEQSGMALFWAMAMANFLIEVGTSVVLSPIMVRILKIKRKVA